MKPLLPAKQFLWNHYIPAGYVVDAAYKMLYGFPH
jgi:hypothetical protein